jgi:hypothetical protein
LRSWLPVEELEAEELDAMNMAGASPALPDEGRI